MNFNKYKHHIAISILAAVTVVMAINLQSKNRDLLNLDLPTPEVSAPLVSLNNKIENSLCNFPKAQKFDRNIENFMRKWGIKGCSFALMKNDSLIYAKGYGYARIEDSLECEVKNIFRVASVSKLITATAIMKLCESGRLSVNDKVFGQEGILNDTLFTKGIRDKNLKNITIENLLRHTSGFSNPLGDAAFNMDLVARYMDKDLPLSLDDMVEFASINKLRAKPGNRYNYSNLGYIVLSKIIEKVSKMPYEQYVKDSVLAPAGCYDMHLATNYRNELKDNEVYYYEVKEAEPVEAFDGSKRMVLKSNGGNDVKGLYGAGGWVASPVELLKFVSAINNCNIGNNILTDESIDFMTRASKEYKPAGWANVTKNEWFRSGSMSGTSAMIKKQKDGYTWVLVSNSSSWNGPKLPKAMSSSISKFISAVPQWPKVNLFDN